MLCLNLDYIQKNLIIGNLNGRIHATLISTLFALIVIFNIHGRLSIGILIVNGM